ncbi:MAG TPA: glycosyl hydrolase family 65 protein, partial [Tepidisphaeraceae bacterium]|nr:glycosyl hydrolase family 65 protein [Tepidisphaeraceae bacterium]
MVHSGDLEFVRANLPVLERLLAYFTRHIGASGLFELQDPDNRWYYDIIKTGGINSYYNAIFYQALGELADMEAAAGSTKKADAYRKLAASIKAAFNRVLWKEDAPGGPRYIDWIDSDGKPVLYFCDLCQWRPIVVGIASPEQARKIIATADKRIAQLEKKYGYQGYATLSALWPIPDSANRMPRIQPWGMIMNGGSLLAETYWEVMARARAGDADGAYRRLRFFAQHYQQTHWVPFNCFSIKAVPHCQEPYLADMGIVPAALVNGILGIEPTWNKLAVTPHLPPGWSKAEADILYKGRREHVIIEQGKVTIEPGAKAIEIPPVWYMNANLWKSPTETAKTENIAFGNGGSIALKKIFNDHNAMALWKLDETHQSGLTDTSPLVADATPQHNDGDWVGDVKTDQPGHNAASRAYVFRGTGGISVPIGIGSCVLNADRKVGPYAPLNDSLSFGPKESFTLQCWFKTHSSTNQTLLAQRGAYAMYLKNGRLAACLMQDG